jgi:hypothetical protein
MSQWFIFFLFTQKPKNPLRKNVVGFWNTDRNSAFPIILFLARNTEIVFH